MNTSMIAGPQFQGVTRRGLVASCYGLATLGLGGIYYATEHGANTETIKELTLGTLASLAGGIGLQRMGRSDNKKLDKNA